MKSPRLVFLILLCAVVSRGLGDSGTTFIGMDGGIHPRISPKGNDMAVSYQGAIVVTEPGEFEITVTRGAIKSPFAFHPPVGAILPRVSSNRWTRWISVFCGIPIKKGVAPRPARHGNCFQYNRDLL